MNVHIVQTYILHDQHQSRPDLPETNTLESQYAGSHFTARVTKYFN